jgi:hypothetical protein
MQALAALDRGDRPGYVTVRDADMAAAFPEAAAAWVGAAPETTHDRRRQVAATALLFLAFRAIDTGGTGSRLKILVEAECARVRRGPVALFEQRWLLASLALVEWSGDVTFLTGVPLMGRSCDPEGPSPCDHLSHVRSALPGESLVRLAELAVPGAIATRQPGALAGRMAVARVRPALPVLARVPAVSRLESGLGALLDDPIVGTDARLRLGLLRYGLNQRRESLEELARVIATSAHAEERATAHYVSSLIHDAEFRPADALHSLENALAAMLHARSISLSLAMRYYLAGRVNDSATLLDATFGGDPPAFDPARSRHAVWTWYQAFDRLVELLK